MKADKHDKRWLTYATQLAKRGRGRVHPNPMVGCVLIKEGKIVGEGWHQEYGGPHAEVIATRQAQKDANGSTAYLTLEPCNHQGKTGPCSEHLIEMGVKKVVFAASEPSSTACGGAKRLKAAGVDVHGPVGESSLGECVDPAFFYNAKHHRTYLALKLAVSADGMITNNRRERTFLTGDESNTEVHRLRSGFQGIVVGSNTARVDDPLLIVRKSPVEPRVPPTRIVISTDGALSTQSNLFDSVNEAPVLVIVSEKATAESVNRLRSTGARVEMIGCRGDRVDLGEALKLMWEKGLKSVMCEGGAELTQSLCMLDLVQTLYLFRTGHLLGPGAVPAFTEMVAPWNSKCWLVRENQAMFGKDVLTIYDRER